jgi:hypothetical protein
MAEQGTAPAGGSTLGGAGKPLSLGRLSVSWLDRLPNRAGPFLALVGSLGALSWVAGLLLAEDRARFLASREWQTQPLYLAIHLVVVRLFVTAYAGGYLAGCRALAMRPAESKRRARLVLGPIGFLTALALAAPLAWLDVRHVGSDQFGSAMTTQTGVVAAGDWLLVALWTLEWIANTFVWVVIVGFLFASLHALEHHEFRDPVMKVLRERQYRPFLLMSSRGATIVLGFTVVNALYVLYAGGETSDYVGIGVTAGLLLAAFVPPWLRLRGHITALVREETDRLAGPMESALETSGGMDKDPPPPRTVAEIGERMNLTFALLRIEHLERLHADMGKTEAQAVLLRLLAPVATIGWRLLRGG